jgi:hypothetical protein
MDNKLDNFSNLSSLRATKPIGKSQVVLKRTSSIIIGGFELRTESVVMKHPRRHQDQGGVAWNNIMNILDAIEKKTAEQIDVLKTHANKEVVHTDIPSPHDL